MNIAKIATMQVGDIDHISTNIYFSKCNNNCEYCHNPELKCGCINENYSIDEILELCITDWVCLMGGEPFHSCGRCELENLISNLHLSNKLVCLFTSEFVPTLIGSVDHYHWHTTMAYDWNKYFVRSFPYKKLSISYVSYGEFKPEFFSSLMKSFPIYVREAVGFESMSHPHRDAEKLREMGFKYIFKNGEVIIV